MDDSNSNPKQEHQYGEVQEGYSSVKGDSFLYDISGTIEQPLAPSSTPTQAEIQPASPSSVPTQTDTQPATPAPNIATTNSAQSQPEPKEEN